MTLKKLFVTLSIALTAPLALTIPAAAAGGSFARPIEKAHEMRTWRSAGAFATGITVEFGGQQILDGVFVTDPTVGRVRLELADGTVVVHNESGVWKSPASSEFQGARFHVLTWPYFLAAPTKLRDPGTNLKKIGELPFVDGEKNLAARLTFDKGVGDSPDDWYVVYRDNETKRLAGMAYIVTFGKDTAEAEKEPHAITYHDYQDVNGVPIPTRWQFWNWSLEKGIEGDPIGQVKLTNPLFGNPAPEAFATPEGAEAQPLPGS